MWISTIIRTYIRTSINKNENFDEICFVILFCILFFHFAIVSKARVFEIRFNWMTKGTWKIKEKTLKKDEFSHHTEEYKSFGAVETTKVKLPRSITQVIQSTKLGRRLNLNSKGFSDLTKRHNKVKKKWALWNWGVLTMSVWRGQRLDVAGPLRDNWKVKNIVRIRSFKFN